MEPDLGVDAFRQVLVESGLGARRPVDDAGRLAKMLAQADLLVTARAGSGGALLGVARSLSDGAFACYLSDLAVVRRAQGLGIGRRLVEETRRRVGPEASVILVAVPEAVAFYERVGMARLADCFWFRRER